MPRSKISPGPTVLAAVQAAADRYELTVEDVLTPDQIAGIDARIGGPREAGT